MKRFLLSLVLLLGITFFTTTPVQAGWIDCSPLPIAMCSLGLGPMAPQNGCGPNQFGCCDDSTSCNICGDSACDFIQLYDGSGNPTGTIPETNGNCPGDCPAPVCGDGTLEAPEACDDGNVANGDGCSSTCVVETCTDGIQNNSETGLDCGGPFCAACTGGTCGDGTVDPTGFDLIPGNADDEECDDGGVANGDGCNSTCKIEPTCGASVNTCGVGVLSPSLPPGSVCAPGLTNAPQWICDSISGAASVACHAVCDGTVGTGLLFPGDCLNCCIDNDGDGYGAGCGPGPDCNDGDPTVNPGAPEICNGFDDNCAGGVDEGGDSLCTDPFSCTLDQCLGFSGCSNNPSPAVYFACAGITCQAFASDPFTCTSSCGSDADCGGCYDGITDGDGVDNIPGNGDDEECDDGNFSNNDGCTTACNLATCGDGFTQPGEQCDDANGINNDGCTNACALPVCGDGITNGTDQCDDANGINNDGCTNACTLPVCGDGITNAGDQCDDGNLVNNDGCTNACTLPVCGDSITNGTDQCDDGNLVNNDGCTNGCLLPACGDTFLQAGESCDDGNVTSGDGCSATCALESCGNGVTEGVEQCDDANGINNDGCTNACTLPVCGDAITNGGDQCDDGNLSNTDGCTNACLLPACGDTFVQAGETCDDGNVTPGDGCDATCQTEAGPICGDGIVNGGDQCDDANLINTDACTNTCLFTVDMNLVKTVSNATPTIGTNVTFTITLNNSGFNPSAGVTVRDVLPSGYSFVSATPSQGSFLAPTWTVGTVNPAQTVTLQIVATVLPAGIYTNFAQVFTAGSVDIDSTPGNDVGNTPNEDDEDDIAVAPIGAPICGDGSIDVGEQCDDSNVVSGDGCSATCTIESCGDGVTDPNGPDNIGGNGDDEQCDDANLNNVDGCTNTCIENGTIGVAKRVTVVIDNGNGTYDINLDFVVENLNSTTLNNIQLTDNLVTTFGAVPFTILTLGATGGYTTNGLFDGNGDINLLTAGQSLPAFTSFNVNLSIRITPGIDPGPWSNFATATGFTPLGNPVTDISTDGANTDPNGDGDPIENTPTPIAIGPAVCGNGTLESGEACDDGNLINGDTCTNTCTLPICGNGITEVGIGEQCDDGNLNNSDACTNACDFPFCGDGVLTPPEACDDLNNSPNDGCGPSCAVEFCGDGITNNFTETCDDGNAVPGDGCDATCLVECGNGTVDPGETCDDSNLVSGDGCDFSCQTEVACGNSIIEVGEQCDDGNLVSGDGCNAACVIEACGNATLDVGEACDDGNLVSGDGCSATCTLESCGNGITEVGEQCDDANVSNADACSNLCLFTIDLSLAKTVSNPTPTVGTNVTFTITVTNNSVSGTATGVTVRDVLPTGYSFVSSTPSQGAFVAPTWTIGNLAPAQVVTLQIVATVLPVGIYTNFAQVMTATGTDIDSTPGNDVGNTPNEDDEAAVSTAPVPAAACGDGTINVGEQCDDGNLVSGDGCNAACVIEACGNATLDVGEACDDGNLVSGDGCSATCTLESCGNGITEVGEQCDDANVSNADACSNLCLFTIDLSLAKTVSNPTPTVGTNVTFTITVTNNSVSGTATGVTVRDVLPTGYSFVSSTPSQGAFVAPTWTIGNLAPAQVVTLQIVATVLPVGIYTNFAQVMTATGTDIDSTPGNDVGNTPNEDDEADILVTPSALCGDGVVNGTDQCDDGNAVNNDACTNACTLPVCGDGIVNGADICDDGNAVNTDTCSNACTPTIDLGLTKVVDNATPNVGDVITFTLSLSNTGTGSATGVVVRDILPSGYTFGVATPSQGTFLAPDWTVGTVAAGQTVTMTITATVLSTGIYSNFVQVFTATGVDVNSTPGNDVGNTPNENDEASSSPSIQIADPGITKTVDNPNPDLNGIISYFITVTNNGPTAALNVVVTDILPPGLTLQTANVTAGVLTLPTWTLANMAPFAVETLTITARVDVAAPITNSATLTSTTFDPDPSNNQDDVTITPVVGTVRGHLFWDDNRDGDQDVPEDADLANISLRITDSRGTFIVVTDALGNYVATVAPGMVNIAVDATDPDLPEDYVITVDLFNRTVNVLGSQDLTVHYLGIDDEEHNPGQEDNDKKKKKSRSITVNMQRSLASTGIPLGAGTAVGFASLMGIIGLNLRRAKRY